MELKKVISQRYKDKEFDLIIDFLIKNVEKAILWDAMQAKREFDRQNYTLLNLPSLEKFKQVLNLDEVDDFLNKQTLKQKRVTIRKIIASFDENQQLTVNQLKALEGLKELLDEQTTPTKQTTVYIQNNSNIRFDMQEKEFDNVRITNNED